MFSKLVGDLAIVDNVLSVSPVLHHKLPSRPIAGEDNQTQESEDSEDRQVKTNLYGVKYVLWFDIGIEGKDPMDQEEEDWGGTIEFGFQDKKFCKEVEDYFLPFEDKCTLLHSCAGRVMGVLAHVRDMVVKAPLHDPRNIVDLVE